MRGREGAVEAREPDEEWAGEDNVAEEREERVRRWTGRAEARREVFVTL